MGKETFQRNSELSWTNALQVFDRSVSLPDSRSIGESHVISRVASLSRDKEGRIYRESFRAVDYTVEYPQSVKNALFRLYQKYNHSFAGLIARNREWNTDYRHCFVGGYPVNRWVQIDMVGLPEEFLAQAMFYPEDTLVEVLRRRIFEIENSLAMYQLLQEMFSSVDQDSLFKQEFRRSLDVVREQIGMPIALLAVTQQKYEAMKLSEFGKRPEEPITDEEVRTLSGFDRFFGPDEFEEYLRNNNGECGYLLYARTSDPVVKLRDPSVSVSIPLLEKPETRRIIRANALTFNVDDPTWSVGDQRRINDTKEWMPTVGFGLLVGSSDDVYDLIRDGRGSSIAVPSRNLISFLQTRGVVVDDQMTARAIRLRAKPAQASYGCYGHISGSVADKDFRNELRRNLTLRGPYIVQPELASPIITDSQTGQTYTYIDRNFIWTDGRDFYWMGGFRSLMPIDSVEAKNGRNHGSRFTVWGRIV